MLQILGLVGKIEPPPGIKEWSKVGCSSAAAVCGLVPFLNALIRLAIVVAGLYAFINLILAGYQFMSAGGEPKQVEKAWAKIWQSLIGLLIIAGSFVLAAIFGYLLFQDPGAILYPRITTP